jgi:dienelactone hydrolase
MSGLTRRTVLAAAAAAIASPAVALAQHSHESEDEPVIAGFELERFTALGSTREVYVQGEGPAVLLMHELPGLSWPTILLAQRLASRGFRVYMPRLFGGIGQRNGLLGYFQSCFGPQFDCSDPAGTSRIIGWLRALTGDIARRHDNRPMGAIGMCLTGSFPIALMDTAALVSVVLSQPALPLRANDDEKRRALGLSQEEMSRARDRQDGRALALRFSADELCPPQRFETIRGLFRERFEEPVVIPSGPGTAFPDDAHAVLTGWYRNTPASPTRMAFERVATFLTDTLASGAARAG